VQAQRALRGLIHAWHAAREQDLDAIPAGVREPPEHEFRHAVLAGLASVPRVPGPENSTKQKPGRELPEFCRDRRSDVLLFTEDTSVWPANNISERGVRPLKTSTAATPWTSCTTSCSAGPGARPSAVPVTSAGLRARGPGSLTG